jgi:hypothetical protein
MRGKQCSVDPPHFGREHKVAQPQRSFMGTLLALLGAGLAGLYLANLGFGTFGEIPDALPLVGNLDEVLASAVLFSCLSYLGINVVPNRWQPSVGRQKAELLEDRRANVAQSP